MTPDPNEYDLDPVYVNAKREAKFILVVFAVFAVYTLSVSYALGYQDPEASQGEARLVWGLPAWVFWGILLPWMLANVVTAWFCFGFMKIDELDDANLDAESASQIAAASKPPDDNGSSDRPVAGDQGG